MQLSLRLQQGLRALQPSFQQSALSSRAASSRLFSQLSSHPLRLSAPLYYLQRNTRIAVPSIQIHARCNSSDATPSNPLTDRTADPATEQENAEQNKQRREQEPAYQITFTCKPCGERSSHRMSKHGYHRGTVLIRCPSCQNRHVISDNLNIFFDSKKTLEDILQEQGGKLTRGYVDGDMEFWDDGSVVKKAEQETKTESK